MSHHNEHHEAEQKPIAFSVPFILAAVTLLVIILFLSLCDPKPHHDANHGHEATHHEAAATEHHAEAAVDAPAASAEANAEEAHH